MQKNISLSSLKPDEKSRGCDLQFALQTGYADDNNATLEVEGITVQISGELCKLELSLYREGKEQKWFDWAIKSSSLDDQEHTDQGIAELPPLTSNRRYAIRLLFGSRQCNQVGKRNE